MAKVKKVQKSRVDLDNILFTCQEATMERLNCHLIGRIEEFDSATQTCTIQLMQLKQLNDETYIPTLITEVPLIIYGCGDATITLPNPVGSICLVLFLDRNIDAFMETGEQYVPETTRMHDFTDCVALTTFKTLVNPIDNYDENSISINYQSLVSNILYYSTIKNFGNSVNIKVVDENELSAGIIDVQNNAIDLSVGNEIVSANIQIDQKIQIQNTARNLLTLMVALITAIKGLTISGSTVSQASQEALDEIAEQFGELLK